MTDQMCLNKDGDICLMDYDFIYASFIQYPKLDDEFGEPQLDGVIPFNRYEYETDPSHRLIYSLNQEDVIWRYAVQLDLNIFQAVYKDLDFTGESYLTLNGIDKKNILYSDDDTDGFVFFDNKAQESKWLLYITNATLGSINIFQKYEQVENGSPAVIATATNSIKGPMEDF